MLRRIWVHRQLYILKIRKRTAYTGEFMYPICDIKIYAYIVPRHIVPVSISTTCMKTSEVDNSRGIRFSFTKLWTLSGSAFWALFAAVCMQSANIAGIHIVVFRLNLPGNFINEFGCFKFLSNMHVYICSCSYVVKARSNKNYNKKMKPSSQLFR